MLIANLRANIGIISSQKTVLENISRNDRRIGMASIFDVAKYILNKAGAMCTWKLQKLCYYSQAWSMLKLSNYFSI